MKSTELIKGFVRSACFATLLGLAWLPGVAPAKAAENHDADVKQVLTWEDSIVTLEVSRKQYDHYQPWTRRAGRALKTGVVIGEKQILTTADELYDRTLLRLQKGGSGRWRQGDVTWIDYHANLALVTVAEPEFWEGLKPAQLAPSMLGQREFQLLRWRNGNLERRSAEFTQYNVREGQISSVNYAVLEGDSDLQGGGWSEALVLNGNLAGLVTSQDGRTFTALPASFIRPVLSALARKSYHGLGFFHFVWQPGDNPASLESLGLKEQSRGVIVIEVPPRPDDHEQVMRPKDIILNIDGFDIDTHGNYRDPECGSLLLENLATRGKWAGDEVTLQVWREGKTMELKYRLPKYDYSISLVPFAVFDKDPEYLIMGGLLFQPLTDPYLQSWGPEWRRRAPFRLVHYRSENVTKERPSLVLLSQVLPDPYNIGYQEYKCLVVDKVNGQRISRLSDLRQAFSNPSDGYHIIEFMQSDTLRRMVLAAGDTEAQATARVLKRYGINQPFSGNQE